MSIKSFCFFILLFCFSPVGNSQLYFPPTSGTWETLSPDSLGWCPEKIQVLYDFLDSTNTKAFIVLKDGKIVLEKYFGTFTASDPHQWNSAGKTLAAFIVGKAQEDGYLSITDTTSTYLGQNWTAMSPTQEEKITIKHQLTMTTGLSDSGSFDCTTPACLTYMADAGTRWSYHNAPYTLLHDVIQSATGQTMNAYLASKLTGTGITGLYLPIGDNKVFFSSARNFARFGLLLQADGNWNGASILADQNFLNDLRTSSQSINPSYGYLTWLNGQSSYMVPSVQFSFPGSMMPNTPSDVYAALGKNSQLLNVVPSQGLVMIRMGEGDGISLVGNQYNDSVWIRLNDLGCTTGLEEASTFSNLEIFPNPSSGHFTVKGLLFNDQLNLFNAMGQKVQFTRTNDSFSTVDHGLFFLEIKRNHKTTIQKILIQ